MDQSKPENKLKPLTDDEIRQVFNSKNSWLEPETITFDCLGFARAILKKASEK